MLHAVLAVLLTFVTTNLAGFGTGLERGPDQLGLEGRLAGENASRGAAHVGAVEVRSGQLLPSGPRVSDGVDPILPSLAIHGVAANKSSRTRSPAPWAA